MYDKNRNNSVVRGYVYTAEGKSVKNPVIIVQKGNDFDGEFEDIGYLIGDDQGRFILAIEDIDSDYKLIAYDSKLKQLESSKISLDKE